MIRLAPFFAVLGLLAFAPSVTAQILMQEPEPQPSAAEYPEDAPDWQVFGEAVADAQAEGDLVLVHAYAVWCGWCRRLDADVYTDDAVQAYLSEHYEVTRLDTESPQEIDFFGGTVTMRELASALGLSSTPTTVFFTADGQYINKAPGYWPPEKFVLLLRYVEEEAYEMMNFQDYAEMMEAQRSPEVPSAPAPSGDDS